MTGRSGLEAPDAVEGCLESCRRLDALIASIVSQDEDAYPSIGPHLRHCLDHFRLLLDGWPTGRIDYDDRGRDPRLERDPSAARAVLLDLVDRLAGLATADLSREISVLQAAAPGRPPVASPSRLERELIFLSSHTIHHIAIMILSARAAGIALPDELGIAYSTDLHRSSLAATD